MTKRKNFTQMALFSDCSESLRHMVTGWTSGISTWMRLWVKTSPRMTRCNTLFFGCLVGGSQAQGQGGHCWLPRAWQEDSGKEGVLLYWHLNVCQGHHGHLPKPIPDWVSLQRCKAVYRVTHCQSRKRESLDFAFNMSLSSINVASFFSGAAACIFLSLM